MQENKLELEIPGNQAQNRYFIRIERSLHEIFNASLEGKNR